MVLRLIRVGVVLVFGFGSVALFAQDPTGPEALQRGFSTLTLGMTFDEASAALADDPNFRYRGQPDVQFLPVSHIPIIETQGRAFVARGILQFSDDALYVIALLLDQTRLDYFTVYRSLVAKYGEPTSLDPGQAIWEDERTRIALERPLTVKYIDELVFKAILEAGQSQQALDEITRDRFLSGL